MKELIKINSRDNVVIALRPFSKGDVIDVDGNSIPLLDDIEKGHKIALQDIAAGADILKYGYPIGQATEAIKKGQHVHVHN
ncbi:MAG: altronate dehydratase, partial [Sphingobacteriales bacterium]